MNSPHLATDFLDDAAIVAGFAALAHPARLEILRELGARDACCCKDVVERLDLAQSTVSQHLRVLVDAGLVIYEPDNRRSRYSLDHARLSALEDAMGRVLNMCCSARGR
jgi:DNA-binding transcriptional ArsR family regulator